MSARHVFSHRWAFAPATLLVLLPASIVTAAQDEPEAPLPEGHYRIVSAEVATTSSVSVVEIVVEAPVGLRCSLHGEGEPGQRRESSLGVSAEPGEAIGTVRFIARADRFEPLPQNLRMRGPAGMEEPPPGTYGMFWTRSIGHSGNTRGGAASWSRAIGPSTRC